jgi:hypothetical protein
MPELPERGWGSLGKRGLAVRRSSLPAPNLPQTRKGRSARRGGSCPAVKVWTCWATRSSYESRVCRCHFAPPSRNGNEELGRLSALSRQHSALVGQGCHPQGGYCVRLRKNPRPSKTSLDGAPSRFFSGPPAWKINSFRFWRAGLLDSSYNSLVGTINVSNFRSDILGPPILEPLFDRNLEPFT